MKPRLKMNKMILPILIASLTLFAGTGRPMAEKKKAKLLKRIDHIMIESKNPSEAIKLFHEGLGLPLAWPLKDHGGYLSGGIGFGNINVEYISFKNGGRNRLAGIAFEANEKIDHAIQMLNKNGIASRIGERTKGYTSLILEFEGLRALPFICEYEDDLEDWKKRLDGEFLDSKGGTLSIKGIQAISVIDINSNVSPGRWRKIVPEVAGHNLRFEKGPTLTLSQDQEYIEIAVSSLKEAIERLQKMNRIKIERGSIFRFQEIEYRLIGKQGSD